MQTSLTTQAAARWDEGGAPVLFSRPGDRYQAVTAQAHTPDGSIVVGAGIDAQTGKGVAYRWTAAGGVQGLLNPTSGYYAIAGATAVDVSGDGRVIVGYGENVAGRKEAIFWMDERPFRVSDAALSASVLPPSWEPFTAHGTDYFGNSICGYGQATSGKLEAYVLILDATPSPPALESPVVSVSYDRDRHLLSLRHATLPGLRYRVRGGSTVGALEPLEEWRRGLGIVREFVADAAITDSASQFLLELEVAAD